MVLDEAMIARPLLGQRVDEVKPSARGSRQTRSRADRAKFLSNTSVMAREQHLGANRLGPFDSAMVLECGTGCWGDRRLRDGELSTPRTHGRPRYEGAKNHALRRLSTFGMSAIAA